MFGEIEMTKEEVVVAYFKILSWNFSGETEENKWNLGQFSKRLDRDAIRVLAEQKSEAWASFLGNIIKD